MRYQFTPLRRDQFKKKKKKQTSVGKSVEQLESSCTAADRLWKTALQVLNKLNAELPEHPVIPLRSIYPKDPGTGV